MILYFVHTVGFLTPSGLNGSRTGSERSFFCHHDPPMLGGHPVNEDSGMTTTVSCRLSSARVPWSRNAGNSFSEGPGMKQEGPPAPD